MSAFQSKFSFGRVIMPVCALLIAFALCLPAQAQERSLSPAAEDVVLTVWRCLPNMAVRIENRGDETMAQVGYYLWEGDAEYLPLEQIQAGYSVFIQHGTAQSIILITYGDGTQTPYIQTVQCRSLFVPFLGAQPQP